MIKTFDIFVTEALNQAKNEHTEHIDMTRGLGDLKTYLMALSIASKATKQSMFTLITTLSI